MKTNTQAIQALNYRDCGRARRSKPTGRMTQAGLIVGLGRIELSALVRARRVAGAVFWLLVLLLAAHAPAACPNLAGRWSMLVDGDQFPWVAFIESPPGDDPWDVRPSDVVFTQNGCSFRYWVNLPGPQGGTYRVVRNGTIQGDSVRITGDAMAPARQLTFSRNSFEAVGKIKGNRIEVDWTVTVLFRMSFDGTRSPEDYVGGSGTGFFIAYGPMVEITNLGPSYLVADSSCTLMGTAVDNDGVAGVYYRLNGGNWLQAEGLTNWAALVTVSQRTNTVEVYATDIHRNEGPHQLVTFLYVIGDRLLARTVGQGTLTPDYGNAVLEVGQAYSMTATPTNGHRFDRWVVGTNWASGPVVTNRTLSFLMQSNLTLTAVFQDTNRPVLSVSNLVANQRISNTVYVVRGSAKDNVGVSNVLYQLNEGDWRRASGTTNWEAPIELRAGSNIFQVYALDAAGNTNVVKSLKCTCVPSAQVQLSTVGQGGFSPDYRNAWLQLGRNWSITAYPSNGHRFDRWLVATNLDVGVVVTNRTLSFLMQSNLTLTAVFLDTNRPILSVSNLVANQRISNSVYVVRGSARDNVGVSNVWFRLNSNGWALANSTSLWAVPLSLEPGTNRFQVYAEDSAQNRSLTNTVTFVCMTAGRLEMRRGVGANVLEITNLNRVPLVLQTSTNLIHWQTVTNFGSNQFQILYQDSSAGQSPALFYRTIVR
jgi:hypothetical protein